MSEEIKQSADAEDAALYTNAAGTGTAAILLFVHIALTGYLAFAMLFVIRRWNSGVLDFPAMAWQYYFPAGLALLSYFPTDGLTRTVALIARIAGAIALALVFTIYGTDSKGGAGRAFTEGANVYTCSVLGLGIAVLAAEWFRLGLPKLPESKRHTIWPLSSLANKLQRIVAGVCWMGMMLVVAGPVFQYAVLKWITVSVCIALLLCRAVRDARRS